ncbi:MAG: glycosyltransferase [Planctomycetaceae bacterium]|nr:glycosyltransferase [Planctomycetaceae bacterium]
MSARRTILFLLPSLECGGAERVATTLLRNLPTDGCQLHLGVLRKSGPLLEDLPDHVVVHDLQRPRVSRALPQLLSVIRRVRPEVVLSSMTHLNLAVASLKPVFPRRTRLVLRETMTAAQSQSIRTLRMLGRRVSGRIYRLADSVICQTDTMKRELADNLRLPEQKLCVVRNPCDFHRLKQLATTGDSPFAHRGPGPHILGLGSLLPVKGFERLVKSFPALLRTSPAAHLWLVGTGPCEHSLRTLARDLNIEDRIHLPGFQKNPALWLRHADLLVSSSWFESAPNILVEAAACECPVIALRQTGGTQEILNLTGQTNRIVSSLDDWKDWWFERPTADVRQRAEEVFGLKTVIADYRQLLLPESPANQRAA